MLNIKRSIESEVIEHHSSIDEPLYGDHEVEGSTPVLGDFFFFFLLGF